MSFFVKLLLLFLLNLAGVLVHDLLTVSVIDDWLVVLGIYLIYTLYFIFLPIVGISIVVAVVDRYWYKILDVFSFNIKILVAIYFVSFVLGLLQVTYLTLLLNQ
jgi:hypothetical protein